MTKDTIVLGNYTNKFIASGEGAYTAIFSQVREPFIKKYTDRLENEGYVKYSETRFDGESEERRNYFATYTNKTHTVDLDFHAYSERMYVTYTPKKDERILPPTSASGFVPVCKTLLTQVGAERFHPAAVSMCYILRAADGSFVIIDSDCFGGAADLIYDILKKQAPDPDNIVISAWFFTHPHSDHVGGFIDFAEKYASDKTFTLKQAVYNFSCPDYLCDNEQNLIVKTYDAVKKFGDGVSFIRPHAGTVLRYADLTFRVLYTQEQYLAPCPHINDSNGSSLVMQMQTDSGVKVLFGADHPVCGNYLGLLFCEGALYRWYGDFIKSDVVTCFHHGFGGGADDKIYHVIKPTVVLWPATIFRIHRDSDGTFYSRPVTESTPNKYFTDPENAKKNGVRDYYISADGIQIMDLSDTKLSVEVFDTCDEYLK